MKSCDRRVPRTSNDSSESEGIEQDPDKAAVGASDSRGGWLRPEIRKSRATGATKSEIRTRLDGGIVRSMAGTCVASAGELPAGLDPASCVWARCESARCPSRCIATVLDSSLAPRPQRRPPSGVPRRRWPTTLRVPTVHALGEVAQQRRPRATVSLPSNLARGETSVRSPALVFEVGPTAARTLAGASFALRGGLWPRIASPPHLLVKLIALLLAILSPSTAARRGSPFYNSSP